MVFSNFHVGENHSHMFPLHCGPPSPQRKKCSVTFALQLQFTIYQLRRSKNKRISYLMQHITLRSVQMMCYELAYDTDFQICRIHHCSGTEVPGENSWLNITECCCHVAHWCTSCHEYCLQCTWICSKHPSRTRR